MNLFKIDAIVNDIRKSKSIKAIISIESFDTSTAILLYCHIVTYVFYPEFDVFPLVSYYQYTSFDTGATKIDRKKTFYELRPKIDGKKRSMS